MQALCAGYGRPSVFHEETYGYRRELSIYSTETDHAQSASDLRGDCQGVPGQRTGRSPYFLYGDAECSCHGAGEYAASSIEEAEFLPNQAMLADMPQEEIVLSPSADVLLNTMIPNYLTGLIYGCLVEAYASENNARMMAMQSSTDSAKKMLRELSIEYNRARQAAITQEITEIVSGAKAQKRK